MKKLAYSLCLAGVLSLPGLVQARPVTLTTQLQNYSGDGAYLAIYVTDAAGKYQKTLWVAGKKAKYYKHLRDWARGSGLTASEFAGVSGASAGSGKTAELRVPLTTQDKGKPTPGRGYIQSFSYDL